MDTERFEHARQLLFEADPVDQGIHPHCLTLDAEADDYVSRIFGPNNYSIVDDIERLPRVFSALTA